MGSNCYLRCSNFIKVVKLFFFFFSKVVNNLYLFKIQKFLRYIKKKKKSSHDHPELYLALPLLHIKQKFKQDLSKNISFEKNCG